MFVIDNDSSITNLFEKEFGGNMSIVFFKSAEEALSALEKNQPAIVIFEYHLPGMSGIEFFEKVQDLVKDEILLIMMSSLDDGNMVLKFIQKGIRNYVIKDDLLVESIKETISEELTN